MKIRYLFACIHLIFAPAMAGDIVIFDGSNTNLLDQPPVSIVDGQSTANSLFPPSKNTSSNMIIVTGGNIPGFVFGGGSEISANVTNNIVVISNGTINNGVYGGWTEGNANYNSVTINGGTTVVGTVRGGYGVDAIGNTVTINGGAVTGNGVYGGWGLTGVTGKVDGNVVTINGGTITREVIGGYNNAGDANNNTVNINGGVLAVTAGNVVGGTATGADSIGNTVNIRGGTIGQIGAPWGSVYAGSSIGGDVKNNTVNLSGGTIYGLVAGIGGANNIGSWQTAGNNLIVSGGQVNVGSITRFQNATITSAGNVNVIGSPWGGVLGAYAVFNDLHNDGILSFYNMPYNGAAPGITGLNQDSAHVQGVYTGSGAIGLDVLINPAAAATDADRILFDNAPSVIVKLAVLPAAGSIQAPNTPVKVATITNGATDGAFTTTEAGYGVYAYDIIRTGPDFFLVINDQYAEELGFVYSEASAAALAQLSRSPDLLHRNVLNNCVRQNGNAGVTVFADMTYTRERIKVGSHVDINGSDGLVAFSYNCGAPLSFGAFGEFFMGDYETSNVSRTNLGSFVVKSDGDIKTVGTGLFVQYRPEKFRKDSENLPDGGLRLEGSVRLGSSSLDFSDSALIDTDFKKRNAYWGVTVAGAYVFPLTGDSKMELFSQGVWTSQNQKTVTDGIGQKIDFNSAHSLRILAGSRVDFSVWDNLRPFASMAINWETSGKPEVHINRYKAKVAKLTGISGIVELGFSVASNKNTQVDLKGTGMFGRRDGFGGELQVKHEF